MKRVVAAVQAIAVVATLAFVVMLFTNEPGGGEKPQPPRGGGAAQGAPAAAVDGAALYSSRCSGCHGADGEGGVGPQLAGRVEQRFPDVDDQVAVVSGGRGGMPSFADRLTAEEIQAVVDYTRTS